MKQATHKATDAGSLESTEQIRATTQNAATSSNQINNSPPARQASPSPTDQTVRSSIQSDDIASTPQHPQQPIKQPALSNIPEHLHPIPQPKPVTPPKIDFIETGSLFGDRKRVGPELMLEIENGRFRSPGMSKVIRGPGGRAIKVSFVSGFPNIKSIESRNTQQQQYKAKKSIDSYSGVKLVNSTDSLQNFKSTKTQTGRKSLKSYKSVNSIDDSAIKSEANKR